MKQIRVGDLVVVDFLVHMARPHYRDLEVCLILKKPSNEGESKTNYYTVWSLKDMCFRHVGSHYMIEVFHYD